MSKINKIFLKNLCSYISDNFKYEKIEIDKYLVEIESDVLSKFRSQIEKQAYSDYLCDSNEDSYHKLIDIMKLMLNNQGASAKIRLIERYKTYYIENTELGINVRDNKLDKKKYLSILNKAQMLDSKVKGDFFEEFCSYFLDDIGFKNSYKTPSSGDFGIDIVAKIPFKTDSVIFKYLLNPDAYVLVQCKYLSSKADTPLIRKIIGDSYYYRLHKMNSDSVDFKIANSPLYLLLISHNGFTNKATIFANENKVNILDTDKIIDLVFQNKDFSQFKCVKFLDNKNADNM